MIRIIMVLLVLFHSCGNEAAFAMSRRHPDPMTYRNMVNAVIGEAEGESFQGKEAVACAIRNRGTLEGVYGLGAPRVRKHLYSKGSYQDAVLAVWMAEDNYKCHNLIHGAQYWEGTDFPVPAWAKSMKLTATIGHQNFYRKD